jgi:multidrug efflux pump
MGGMMSVVVLALLMVPVFFVVVRRTFSKRAPEEATAAPADVAGPIRRWLSFALRWKNQS